MKSPVLSVIFKVIVGAAVICILAIISVWAFSFGRAVFDENTGTDPSPGTYVISIYEDESIFEVADELENVGLIEDRWVFVVQRIFYGNDLTPGTYTLDTNMSGEDILNVFSGDAIDAEGLT